MIEPVRKIMMEDATYDPQTDYSVDGKSLRLNGWKES